MRFTKGSVVAAVISLVVLTGGVANAQLENSLGSGLGLSGSSTAAYYLISKSGEITMPINLWGYVKNPGRYEIPISTDLVQLLSYAGGPLADADLGSVKITRVIQRDNQIRKVEYTVNLNHLDRLDAMSLSLEAGDTIFIDTMSFQIRDIVNIITTAAIITGSIASVIYASRH
ncbi:MAG: SLBB domain-containing protein [Bacteroidota bacterium]